MLALSEFTRIGLPIPTPPPVSAICWLLLILMLVTRLLISEIVQVPIALFPPQIEYRHTNGCNVASMFCHVESTKLIANSVSGRAVTHGQLVRHGTIGVSVRTGSGMI